MLDALAWYLSLQAAALAVWPLVARALAPLDDRGWSVAKVAGPLLLAWLVWLAGMLTPLPYTRATIAVALAGVAAGAWLWPRREARAGLSATWPALGSATRAGDGERRAGEWRPASLAGWLGGRARLVAVWEAVFLGAFSLFAVLRAYEPAIAGTEKPMDMAFLNGFIAAQRLPTEDTWLAGYGVPYYYFGYVLFATLAKLSGVAPGVAYNLAAATVPALAATALAGLAWNVVRAARRAAWLAALSAALAPTLAIFAGNLSAPLELLIARGLLAPDLGRALQVKQLGEGVVPGIWPPAGAWWWRASRVIPNIQPDGINEFPFFSAYLSDLHPHFLALPLEVLALAVVATHIVSGGASLRAPWTQALVALALGSLLTSNTWDVAPFWLLYVGLSAACLLPRSHATPAPCAEQPAEPPPASSAWGKVGPAASWEKVGLVAAGPVGGALIFAPYFVGYGGPPLGLGVVLERTPLGALLVLFGPQMALLAALGLWIRWRVADRRGWAVAAAGAALGLLLGVAGECTLGLLVALMALLLPWPGVFPRLSSAEGFAASLAAFAGAILLGVELLFLRDTFGTRMNTVFKLHYNAWLLAGVGLSIGVGLVLGARQGDAASAGPGETRASLPSPLHTKREPLGYWARWAMAAVAAAAVVAGLVYPVSAIQTRLASAPPGGPTLDGTAFLAPDDAAGVAWLRAQLGGQRPRIVEAVLGQYSPGARMATYSGAATVLGWAGHELQWRGPLPELSRREADVERLYRGGDAAAIREVLDRYGVAYVVVGDLERQQYGQAVDARFEGLLPVAFRSGGLTIYRAR